jgi:ubiquinone/menaquinone biosynthesis C-methylase UbiE
MINPKDIVRDGYDRISYEYRDDAGHSSAGRPDYEGWLAELMPLLNDGDPVLDLGCGCGVPATAILAERYRVTGVDLSPVQIARARRLVPTAQFECADMASIDFPSESFPPSSPSMRSFTSRSRKSRRSSRTSSVGSDPVVICWRR